MISRREFLSVPVAVVAPPTRPLLVGDSLAYMMRPHVPDFDVVAVGGTNADQWNRKHWLRMAIARYRPAVLLVSLGTNDAGVGAVFAKFSKNARSITHRAHDLGVDRVVWLVPPNSRGPRVADALDAAGVEACPAPDGVELYPGDVHPTLRGYAVWSEHVRAFVA